MNLQLYGFIIISAQTSYTIDTFFENMQFLRFLKSQFGEISLKKVLYLLSPQVQNVYLTQLNILLLLGFDQHCMVLVRIELINIKLRNSHIFIGFGSFV